MPYLIGTDEAGYGPNLGPLVISASVWEVPPGTEEAGWYALLPDAVAPALGHGQEPLGAPRLILGDSKVLYRSGKGLRLLEQGVLAVMAAAGHRPRSWREAIDLLAPEWADARHEAPWLEHFDCRLPVEADPAEVARCGEALLRGLARVGVQQIQLRSRIMLEKEFNRLVAVHGSKAALLSHATLALVAGVLQRLRAQPTLVVCDKHGGRDRYQDLLAEHFAPHWIEVREQQRQRSVYRVGPEEARVEFRFEVRAERNLPAALASMVSKYVRELVMRAINAFWSREVPGLRPTAGYPVDARRFKAEIAAAQARLGIPDSLLWRCR